MADGGNNQNQATNHPLALDGAKGWLMMGLTVVFLLLYILALFGLIPNLTDEKTKTLTHLESILFVIIGYYFGRVPGEQIEKTLRGQLADEKHDATQERQGLTMAQQEATSLRTKLTAVKATLASGVPETPKAGLAGKLAGLTIEKDSQTAVRQAVAAALNILED